MWLDALTTNVDRTARNPNLLVWHGRLHPIDHGAALYLQHGGLDPAAHATRPFPQIREHVLLGCAGSILAAHEHLWPQVDRAALEQIVGLVPGEWLGEQDADTYVEYLTRRPEHGGRGSRPRMPERRADPFAYAILRVVPRVERGECFNAGVVLFCRQRDFLGAIVALDLVRLRALAPELPESDVRAHLDAVVKVAEGDPLAGPMAALPASERFGWLVAPSSTVLQRPSNTGPRPIRGPRSSSCSPSWSDARHPAHTAGPPLATRPWPGAHAAASIRPMAMISSPSRRRRPRAAEIGAMSVLLPALEARGERVSIWCGTSVGAINATALASLAHLPVTEQVSRTLALWRAMRKQDVISPIAGPGGARILTRLVKHALGIRGAALASLLDASPLADSLDQWIDWPRLQSNVRRGHVTAACVVATSLETGDPVAFVSSGDPAPSHADDAIRYVKAKLGGEHVRASAAIPVLFPPVEVNTPRSARGHYIDGGTRLNSPIKPALNLGADRVIVVGLEPFAAARSAAGGNGNGSAPKRPGPTGHSPPGIADVAANMLDGLLVDQVAYDLRRLAAINTFFAEDAVTGTSRAARAYRLARGHTPYRPISYALVAPKRRGEIGRLADAVFERRYVPRAWR